jgi:hypothetical protein
MARPAGQAGGPRQLGLPGAGAGAAIAAVCCQLYSRSCGHIWAHGWRGPVQIEVAAPLLVAEAVRVRQRGRHPHVDEELPEVAAEACAAADGPWGDGHDGVACGLPGPHHHSLFCLLTAADSPVPRPSSLIAPASP